jgi:hypothetical protein
MATAPYPDDDDQQALAEAHELLRSSGIAPGASGYDIHTLAAASYAYGWAYGIDRAAGGVGFRAKVHPQQAGEAQPDSVGVGWTPEAALAFALAKAVQRFAAGGLNLQSLSAPASGAKSPDAGVR